MFVNFQSQWFQSYCRAVLETEPILAQSYVKAARSTINDRLQAQDISHDERKAINIASHYLSLIDTLELPQAS